MESHCRFRRARLRAALLGTSALVAALAAISPLHAQQSSWTGAVDGSYLNAGNWSGGTPPPDTAGKGATFASGSNTNISVAIPTTVNNWTFSGTTNFALSGAAITFAGGGAGIGSSSAGQVSIANNFSGALAVQHAGAGSLTLTGIGSTDQVLVGGGTLSVTSGGSLTSTGLALVAQTGSPAAQMVVSGSGSTWNSAGEILVGLGGNAGVLTITEGGAVTVTTPRTVSIESGSRLNLGTGGTAGTITVDQINNAGEIEANFTGASTLAASLQGGGTLTKSGSGTLTLTGVSGHGTAGTVATFVTGGTLRIENGSALGAGDASFANGTMLDLKGGLGSIENNLLVAGNVNINVASGTAAIGNSPANGAITDDGVTPGGISKTGGVRARCSSARTTVSGRDRRRGSAP